MDAANGPRDKGEIEHGQDPAADTQDDLLLKSQRIQAQEISLAPEGLETRMPGTSIRREVLNDDLSMASANTTTGLVTECMAQGVPVEALMQANQVQDIHTPLGGAGKAQMATRAAPTLPSVSASLPVINRRLPPAFILRAERQAADAYRAKVEASRLRRAGRWATSPIPG
jgi:hypothetical protein